MADNHYKNGAISAFKDKLTNIDSAKYLVNQEHMAQLFNQGTYGGSLVEDEGKLVQKNYLKEKILTETNFGFYRLFNVKESEKVVYDI